jgi:predicted metalloprotease with PDZ domain
MATRARASVLLFLALFLPASAAAQAPVEYRLSFKEAEHRLMDVEVIFREVPAGPLELRMSRSSPGRYSLHEFAKNVFDVRVTNATGAPLQTTRPNPHEWSVTGHGGTVRVT